MAALASKWPQLYLTVHVPEGRGYTWFLNMSEKQSNHRELKDGMTQIDKMEPRPLFQEALQQHDNMKTFIELVYSRPIIYDPTRQVDVNWQLQEEEAWWEIAETLKNMGFLVEGPTPLRETWKSLSSRFLKLSRDPLNCAPGKRKAVKRPRDETPDFPQDHVKPKLPRTSASEVDCLAKSDIDFEDDDDAGFYEGLSTESEMGEKPCPENLEEALRNLKAFSTQISRKNCETQGTKFCRTFANFVVAVLRTMEPDVKIRKMREIILLLLK